ncbi:NAD-dependent succinate-semialdehyde dehydrogenase [Nesterenkonia halotolerans]|uniref:Succinate-semialdehyde dehydrogenase/glutarate-semialdehyde dehydrogenase n=1 Tax=Nesterenkonia halotolerans TaxID=225325 RepID=A0ABR9J6M4_9MICC|nr:NAD-dependent succinate-semialdehyde dehydrogenase [Nesterenkonia halotolerans]MBE1514651.1 succinate-semialdehyde dehydrogenase/glutarate-semialdehyde dehydrogenase [Nesterenkonia halotolerans]
MAEQTITAEREASLIQAVPKKLYINGQWVDAQGQATLEVIDPSTGKPLCTVADASEQDGWDALKAAEAAQPGLAAMAPRERADILMRAFELMHERKDDLALLMTLEMGKPLSDSYGEVTYAAEFFRHFAEEATRISGSYQTAPAGNARFLVSKQPVGPSILITPWNFPLAMGTRKLGPAIAAGCTSVLKPAELTPLSMLALADILHEAGLPAGAVNILVTSTSGKVMEPLIRSGIARKLSFTGSTGVGRKLLEQASQHVLRTSMELGGNAGFVVFEDADLEAAVQGALLAKMRNTGEACTAANRIFVHRSVMDEFAQKLSAELEKLPLGRGVEDGVRVGPLVDAKQLNKVDELVTDAVDGGAKVLLGGEPVDREGYFYPPTVLTDIPEGARMRDEEIFGPVAPLTAFDTEEEVVEWINATEYGLVNYVYTESLRRGIRVAEAAESGMVGLNQGAVSNPAAPFGGIKESGLGREGGDIGIEEFLETKYIGIAM